MWDVLRDLGSLGGFVSVIFLVYDRIFRLHPLAYFEPSESGVALRIINVAHETLVFYDYTVAPKVLSLLHDDSLDSIVKAAIIEHRPDATSLWPFIEMIESGKAKQFPVSIRSVSDLADDAVVTIRVFYRSTRRVWPTKRWTTAKIEARDMRALEAKSALAAIE